MEPVDAEPLGAQERAACEAFLDDLPSTAADALVTCGAPEPATLEATSAYRLVTSSPLVVTQSWSKVQVSMSLMASTS